ncbi:MAG: hypothetical protein NC133_00055 [Prevotella sp.]|nr:hypothetical protein [Prevotella sp.]
MTFIIIILAVVTVCSIAALFLRGFKIQDLPNQFNQKTLQTPTMDVWLLEIQDHDSKMEAYKTGVRAINNGWGVYVLPDGEKWTWVAGVYVTENDANDAMGQIGLPENAQLKLYQITGKEFQMTPEEFEPCHQILSAVKNIFNLLLELRTAIVEANESNQLLLDLTTEYNLIKNGADTLQTLNANLQNPLLATIIYTANQNILSLQEIICSETTKTCSLATVNTALLKTIFSLDNF